MDTRRGPNLIHSAPTYSTHAIASLVNNAGCFTIY
jgi:hypothetical protein